jgi:cation transport regulator ChaC
MNTEEREDTPTWCPDQQIYVGGVVPDSAEVQALIDENKGSLRLFGYGSLCWGPGDGILSKPDVKTKPGRARGYKRCWSQKSSDHRGTTSFPGIVCTLLKDEEVEQITHRHSECVPTMTEGLLYTVPSELVKECLAELDFREKGVRIKEPRPMSSSAT